MEERLDWFWLFIVRGIVCDTVSQPVLSVEDGKIPTKKVKAKVWFVFSNSTRFYEYIYKSYWCHTESKQFTTFESHAYIDLGLLDQLLPTLIP